MGNEFRRIGCICVYRSFHFRAYLNYWFSLCMAKGGIGMVLAPEYSDNKKKNGKNKIETIMNSIQFPLLDRTAPNLVISTTLNDLLNWSRLSSLWQLLYGTNCCFIEFASLIGSRFDFDRYGLRNKNNENGPSLVRLYEQIPKPKYVILCGSLHNYKGMFKTDSYSIVRVDKLILVDVYFPGCPPKPKRYRCYNKTCKKISRALYEDRIRSQRANRCFTTNHKFHVRRRFIWEIMIKEFFINHHLLQRSLRKSFSNTKIQYLPELVN
ncbi:hypothetical protein H5410_014939 [Solanum commersonii]|uniref:NADH:ubiquinone oxidoreductase-like 20kDa subunit domain-containing protein n=1 Tax=Solanum commersonii TaxID=4109 RepID=A0A9J5ZSN8_SOLCO|nr:hypothetical protein H5410_014939 [Solanum commersonii]